MSNYTKTTDFAAKDTLPGGDTNKVVRGSEFETEFDAISTAIATKADTAGPTFTGTVTIPTADINGGNIDGTTVGGSTAAAGSFTTLSASSTFTLGGVAITSTAAELNILDGVTSTAAELNILDGVTATTAELNTLDGVTATFSEINILDGVTATTAELNILDGVTATTAELNFVDGVTSNIQTQLDAKGTGTVSSLSDLSVTSTAAELNILDGVTATTAELNILDGVTSTTAELNILDGVTATATELNILDGVTATTAELNILDGVTSTASELNVLDGVTAFLDEDDMSSNSATALASQQSIKAYVDSQGGGGGISNVVEDTTPQLGGSLDVNGQDIVSVSNGNITLTPNGSGLVRLDGNVDIQTGEIVLKNGGTASNIKFYCESSNAHYTQLQSAAHANYSGNVTLTLPPATDTLVGKATTDTLTNKTLTSPKINENVAVTATATEINILDGVTSTTAELNILDGVTSTAAELNILDGVTATTAELNYLDITTLGLTEASKAVTADANGVVSFDNGTIEEVTSITSSSNAATINLRDGNLFEHDLTENVTYTFSNPAASGRASSFVLKVIQDSTARTITWPASVDWAAATAPTLTTTNNGVDVFVFFTIDGGTTYYGFTAGQAMG